MPAQIIKSATYFFFTTRKYPLFLERVSTGYFPSLATSGTGSQVIRDNLAALLIPD